MRLFLYLWISPLASAFLHSTIALRRTSWSLYSESTVLATFNNINAADETVQQLPPHQQQLRIDPIERLEALNLTAPVTEELLPTSPPLTYPKFLTMQDKRVVVTIRYSEHANLKPYFLTVAKKLKASHPDVLLERRILPHVEEDEEAIFEVSVDGKVVVGKGTRQRNKKSECTRQAVFVSMQEMDLAISRARRRRRPSTMYGDEYKEKIKKDAQSSTSSRENWND